MKVKELLKLLDGVDPEAILVWQSAYTQEAGRFSIVRQAYEADWNLGGHKSKACLLKD